MKRWQDIIDRLKEEGDWEAAAALWDARQAVTLTAEEREAVEYETRVAELQGRPKYAELMRQVFARLS